MHIKDLTTDVELNSKALAAVRGGCFALDAKACGGWGAPEMPAPATDWATLNPADIKAYVADAKAGIELPSFDMKQPSLPAVGGPAVDVPAAF